MKFAEFFSAASSRLIPICLKTDTQSTSPCRAIAPSSAGLVLSVRLVSDAKRNYGLGVLFQARASQF